MLLANGLYAVYNTKLSFIHLLVLVIFYFSLFISLLGCLFSLNLFDHPFFYICDSLPKNVLNIYVYCLFQNICFHRKSNGIITTERMNERTNFVFFLFIFLVCRMERCKKHFSLPRRVIYGCE